LEAVAGERNQTCVVLQRGQKGFGINEFVCWRKRRFLAESKINCPLWHFETAKINWIMQHDGGVA